MNLAEYVKCLKSHALNKKISDEAFLNAVLYPYIEAGEIVNKDNEELYFDKSRTSLILNRYEDVPIVLRKSLSKPNIYCYTENNFADFVDVYMNFNEIPTTIEEISNLIKSDKSILNKDVLLGKKDIPHEFLAAVLIECIKLKNDGFDPEGEILRNGAYCIKVVYKDLFRYAFRKRSKEKNIVVIPVDAEFHTHVTRKYEGNDLNEVSASSLHGQFLTRWEQSGENVKELSERIGRSLQNIDHNSGKYPLGTIAVVETSSTIFYLLAISEFDENNNAQSSKEKIVDCIKELSIFYDKYGDGHDLYIPLLGTGKSRAAISLQESYDILINCYRKNKNRIQGNINIVIRKDLEKHVNINKGGN